ncbi:MAG TPA: hypothetical protein VMJ33_08825, partial [Gallionella sp.]|nr:hypothetical protein [Gallionella sp.]
AHAELLLKKGKLRIGTLYEYRDIEKHGTVIGDKEEGKKSLYMDVKYGNWTHNNQPEFSKSVLKIGEGGVVHVIDSTIEVVENSPNIFIFCTTEDFDQNAMADFGYDCCVVIEKPERFFSAISHTIRHKAIFEGVFRCQYVSRRQPHDADHGTHPAIIKDPSYKPQKEVRALWKPIKKNIEPIIIECRDAARYCSLA